MPHLRFPRHTYAVLYAPAYRQKYAEFLKSDFPRVPFTENYDLFCELAELGKELTELHLMKSDKLHKLTVRFQGRGSNVIDKSKKVGRNYQPDVYSTTSSKSIIIVPPPFLREPLPFSVSFSG